MNRFPPESSGACPGSMVTGIKSSRMIFPDGVRPGTVYLQKGQIVDAGDKEHPCDQLLDFGDQYVAPGFIDMHTHGGVGIAFSACNPEDFVAACRFHMQHGTTTLLPTLSAGPLEEMAQAVAVAAQVMDEGMCPVSIPGVHMEGPYLSVAQCGAQRPGVITPPKAEEYIPLVEKYGDYITRWTFAPENDEDQAFCKYIVAHNILPSAGHTNATYEELLPAYEAGCKLITHLYSCNSTITRQQGFRHLGIIESAYLLDEMDAELIADGKHLPPELLRLIFKCKDHAHLALITDSLPPAGLEQKEGIMDGTPYIVEDGVAKLPDRSAFAGSVATTDMLLRTAVECGCTVHDAVQMLTATPARILGLNKGRLETGFDGDITVFDDTLTVHAVFTNGIRRV